jgi:outer membrane immunogenic protein
MNRALALGIGVAAIGVLPAFAADLPPGIPTKAPVVMAAYSWSGCYIGGNVGGKWANTTDSVDVAISATPAFISVPPGSSTATAAFGRDRASTVIGGGQIGCNWQSGSWVFGLEGDGDWQRWSTTRILGAGAVSPFVQGDTFDIRSDWQASARGRIGYAFDRTLLYVTGGAAFTNVKVGANFPIFTSVAGTVFPATVASDSKTLVGATVGGGFEYAFTNNWSFGVEGRYSWYGNQTFSAGSLATVNVGAGVFQFAPVTQTLRIETFEVTARLNWKFDWGDPVVARY